MGKVIITVSGGVAEVYENPDNVDIEIRDYDIEGNENATGIRVDENGAKYWPAHG